MSRPTQTATMNLKASDIMNGKPSAVSSLRQTRKTNEYDDWTKEKLASTLKERYGDGFPLEEEALAKASETDQAMVEAFFRKNHILF